MNDVFGKLSEGAAMPMDAMQIGIIAAVAVLLLLLIVILIRGILSGRKRKAARQQESSSSMDLHFEKNKILVVDRRDDVQPQQTQKPESFVAYENDEVTHNPYNNPGASAAYDPYGSGGGYGAPDRPYENDEVTHNPYNNPGASAAYDPYGSGGGYGVPDRPYENDEITVNPYSGGNDEETVNPYGSFGDGAEETIAPNWAPQTVVRFSVKSPEETFDKEISFSDRMEIGREATCELKLTPMYVSRHHLELSALPDGVYIRNLNPDKSQQYTRLNRVELGDSLMPVNSGDFLEIAYTKITIEIINN